MVILFYQKQFKHKALLLIPTKLTSLNYSCEEKKTRRQIFFFIEINIIKKHNPFCKH